MNEARVAGTRAEDARIDARDETRVHGAMLAVTRTLIVNSTLYRYPSTQVYPVEVATRLVG